MKKVVLVTVYMGKGHGGGPGQPGEGHLTQTRRRRTIRASFQEEVACEMSPKEYKEYAITERVEE